ncbi:fibronectin type III domain-containing protein, partial [Patescibacteria group bacterium]
DGIDDESAINSLSGTIRSDASNLLISFNTSDAFDGTIDEVRILSVARTDADILTEYNNQSNPSTFLAFGTEEAGAACPETCYSNPCNLYIDCISLAESCVEGLYCCSGTCDTDTEDPSIPQNLSSSPSTTRIYLTWDASTDNVGVAGYKIYRDSIEIDDIPSSGQPTESYLDGGLTPDTTYGYNVSAYDAADNESAQSDLEIVTTLTEGADTTPPDRDNSSPTGILSSGTTQTTLSLTTDENSTCKYDTSSGVSYDSMSNTFSTTGTMNHSETITGLIDGGSYTYYVRCEDESNNQNPDDYPISFSVALQGNVINAATCEQVDVQAAIDSANNGDTVMVPAGTCTWTTEVIVTKPLSIIGSGSDINGTKLIASGTMSYGFFYVNGFTSTELMRISGFYFDMIDWTPQYAIRILTNIEIDNLRIDHNIFNQSGIAQIWVGGSKGVIDNNYFYNSNKSISFTAGSMAQANASWDSMDAGTADALFIEDNHFIDDANYSAAYGNEKIGTYNGGKLVIRYNTFNSEDYPLATTFSAIMTHGSAAGGVSGGYWQIGTGARRGQSVVEIYENIMYGKRIDCLASVRGSSNLIYNNTHTDSYGGNALITLDEEEHWQDNNWDPWREVWPAEDQVHNTFIWGNTIDGLVQDSSDIIVYHTNDSCVSSDNPYNCCTGLDIGTCNFIVENRDYFLHEPQDSGGREIFTGENGASGSYPTDGITYPTLGTMIFEPDGPNAYYGYTPYTYPHPLRNEASPVSDCATLGGTCCISGDTCEGGTYTNSSDCGNLCCTGGTCETPQPDTEDPTIPQNLSATVLSPTQIDLLWDASTDNVGVTGYRIYRDTIEIDTTVNTIYSDTGLTPSTTYTYTVSAYDAASNESDQSRPDQVTTPSSDTIPPTGSIIIDSDNEYTTSQDVILTLSAADPSGVTQMVISDTNTFNVSLAEAYLTSKLWTLPIGDGVKNVYAWFKDTVGNWNTTSYSDSIELDTVGPTITNIIQGAPTTDSITITWDTAVEQSTSRIEYGLNTSYGLIEEDLTLTNSHSITLTNLSAGTIYQYKIVSTDEAGNPDESVNRTFTTSPLPDNIAPAAISPFESPNQTQTSVVINWIAPGDDGDTGTAAEYDLRISEASILDTSTPAQKQAWWDQATPVPGLESPLIAGSFQEYEITGLEPATIYYIAIKTRDEMNNWSNISDIAEAITQGELLALLDADPNSGTIPLTSSINVDVSGPITGSINYTFYCNRNDDGTDITEPYDHKLDNTDLESYSYNCTYSTAGTYHPKVIVERGIKITTNGDTIIASNPSTPEDPVTPPVVSGGGGGGGSYTDSIPPQQ